MTLTELLDKLTSNRDSRKGMDDGMSRGIAHGLSIAINHLEAIMAANTKVTTHVMAFGGSEYQVPSLGEADALRFYYKVEEQDRLMKVTQRTTISITETTEQLLHPTTPTK